MRVFVFLSTALLFSGQLGASDWPQFLGPTRNGVSPETFAEPVWPKPAPAILWRASIGSGFSGPVVSAGKVVAFHRRGDKEIVAAFDARTGNPLWISDYPTLYRDDFGMDEGPRGTPAIAGGRVYTFGVEGTLSCHELETGAKVWSVDTRAAFQARKGFFGLACSPLVVFTGGPYAHTRHRNTYQEIDDRPLFDSERYRRHLETAYQLMYERCLAGEAAADFDVPP